MSFAIAVIVHTPFYVWFGFAYLVWQGVQALRPRTMPVWRVLLVPALFIASGVLPLFWRAGGGLLLASWAVAAVLFWPVGRATGPRVLAVDRLAGRLTRAGSPVPLVRNLVDFALQYGLAVASALHAGPALPLAVASRAVSGATAGYFAGWAVAVMLCYRGVSGNRSGQNASPSGSPPRS